MIKLILSTGIAKKMLSEDDERLVSRIDRIIAGGNKDMIKDESNRVLLEIVDDLRGIKTLVDKDIKRRLEKAEKGILEVLEVEHNGKVFRKENGR